MFKILSLLFCLLFLFSCKVYPLERTDSQSPICLYSTDIPEETIIKAANIWNERLNTKVVQPFPYCSNDIVFIPIIQIDNDSEICYYSACTVTTKISNNILSSKIYLKKDFTFRTLMHEVGHIIGCEHDDYLPPCWE